MGRLKEILKTHADEDYFPYMTATGEMPPPEQREVTPNIEPLQENSNNAGGTPPGGDEKEKRKQESEAIFFTDYSDPDTFGEPLLFGEIHTPEIVIDFLPDWCRNFAQAVADHTQVSPGAIAMLMLAVLGACLQKRFEVSPYNDNYNEPFVLWSLVLLPPGSRKTAILKLLMEPVIEWIREQAERLAPEIDKQRTERAVMQQRVKNLEHEAAKTEDSAK